MKLSAFMRANEEAILQAWEEYAATLLHATEEMNRDELRDHARQMLQAMADDLDEPQARRAQFEKSRGHLPRGNGETAAEAHGSNRMEWGFSIGEMVSEFRALRASVIRLWSEPERLSGPNEIEDMIRFNEAMDQALAESIESYSTEKEQEVRILNGMLAHSPDHSFVLDFDGRFLFVNRSMADVHGKHPYDMIGRSVDELELPSAAEFHSRIRQVKGTGQEHRGEMALGTATGEERVIEYLFAPILDEAGRIEAIAGNSRDITGRKAWEQTLWRYANHDHLTGVPNRRLFLDRLEQELKQARRTHELLALLFIDLDDFKQANDHLGHDGGDLLLQGAVARIRECVRETDTLARMGGDEFTVILMNVQDAEQVGMVVKKILAELEEPFSIHDETVRVSASIGVAVFPDDGDSADELLAHADQAMYSVKNAGGSRFGFYRHAAHPGRPRPPSQPRRPH